MTHLACCVPVGLHKTHVGVGLAPSFPDVSLDVHVDPTIPGESAAELPDAIQRALDHAPAPIDIAVTRDAQSTDPKSGIGDRARLSGSIRVGRGRATEKAPDGLTAATRPYLRMFTAFRSEKFSLSPTASCQESGVSAGKSYMRGKYEDDRGVLPRRMGS